MSRGHHLGTVAVGAIAGGKSLLGCLKPYTPTFFVLFSSSSLHDNEVFLIFGRHVS